MARSVSIFLGDVEYSVTNLGLRKWLELEETNNKIIEFMKGRSMIDAANAICFYLSLVINLDVTEIKSCFWLEVAEAYANITTYCLPSIDFPLLKDKTEEQMVAWDYEGRTWYIWAHLLAEKYGWSLGEIANLYFEDAIALLQEILVSEQLKKEWQWSMTEIAYPYNESTRKSEFKPLPRPLWMNGASRKKYKEPEKVRMPTNMMPMGIILKWEEDEKIIN